MQRSKVDFIIISGSFENDYISKSSIYFLDDLFKSVNDINIFIVREIMIRT